mmetsp:Transcript_60754/g.169843  ORF Transcript_60754/g.169843 Transcript_60754/m.169843 type:complete len:91 (-) Transcript_60754:542-814(-)
MQTLRCTTTQYQPGVLQYCFTFRRVLVSGVFLAAAFPLSFLWCPSWPWRRFASLAGHAPAKACACKKWIKVKGAPLQGGLRQPIGLGYAI